jgi:Fe-S cluster biogenesis protein NfuA
MPNEEMQRRVEASLAEIRPYLEVDGGGVEFVRFREEGILEIRWTGTCAVCPMSRLTLRAGVERRLLRDIPELRRVEAVSA